MGVMAEALVDEHSFFSEWSARSQCVQRNPVINFPEPARQCLTSRVKTGNVFTWSPSSQIDGHRSFEHTPKIDFI
jgi:hypothetical protein